MSIVTVPGKLTVDYQGAADVDGVYVRGSTPAGSGPFWSSHFPGQGLVPPRSPARMAMVDAPNSTDQTTAAAAALVELSRRQAAVTITAVVTGKDGWQKGQALLITSGVFGWTAKQFVITAVNLPRVMSGVGTRQYALTAGTDPVSFRRRIAGIHAGTTHKAIAATRIMGTLTPGGGMPDSG